MKNKKSLMVILVIFAIVILSACSKNNKEEQAVSNEPKKVEKAKKVEKEEKENNNDVYFKDGELKLVDFKLKITDERVIQPGESGNEYSDKPVIAFWYEVTNLGDKDISPMIAWSAAFNAIQDNDPNKVNELKTASHPDSSLVDDQMADIKKDGTVKGAWAYELSDEETNVTLIAQQGIGGKELGKQDYQIK